MAYVLLYRKGPAPGPEDIYLDTTLSEVGQFTVNQDWVSLSALADAAHAHVAADIAFTPAGNLAAEDVQAALEELDTEKAGV